MTPTRAHSKGKPMTHERRRHHPSYSIPTLYLILEVIMGWLIISFIEFTTDVYMWSVLSIGLLFAWVLYSFKKYLKVLKRQNIHHINNI